MNHLSVAMDAGVDPASATSTVAKQLNRVNDQIHQLESVIGSLFGQLKPVLTPDRPVAECASVGSMKAESQSPISDQLGTIAYQLEANVDYLRSLLSRIEV